MCNRKGEKMSFGAFEMNCWYGEKIQYKKSLIARDFCSKMYPDHTISKSTEC